MVENTLIHRSRKLDIIFDDVSTILTSLSSQNSTQQLKIYQTVFFLLVPNHHRSLLNLKNFKEAQKLLGEKRSQESNPGGQEFGYLASGLPQNTLKSFDWFEERKIFKKLCRGEPIPQVSQT